MNVVLPSEPFRAPVLVEPVPIGRPALLSLQLGTARRFGVEDIGETGMVGGWAGSEPGHAWNDGVDATLVVATRHHPGPVELTVEVEPYVTRQNPVQELTLYANGARAGYWRLSQREVTPLTAWIDPGWWRNVNDRAVLRLVFHMPQSISPAELGECNDLRQLGLSFRSIVLAASRIEA